MANSKPLYHHYSGKFMENSNSDIRLEFKAGELEVSDPNNVLKECTIFFAFPKSRSANFPIALGLAKSATAYGEQSIEGRTLYWAGFTLSPNDLKSAAELLRLAGGWVGTMAKINGHRISNPFNAYLTLSCYQEALQCSSQAAHCHKIIDDPFHKDYDSYSQTVKDKVNYFMDEGNYLETTEEVKEFVYPCKKMLESSMFHPQFNFKRVHQVSEQEQIQAAAVQYGISICPFFDASSFQEIGSHAKKVRTTIIK